MIPLIFWNDKLIGNQVVNKIASHSAGITEKVDLYWCGAKGKNSAATISGMPCQIDKYVDIVFVYPVCNI